jgi:hypothetical protein
LTAQSADLDLALERDQRAQGFVNHLAFVSNAGHPAGALDEFIVNVNVNMHVVRPLYTCAGCVRPPARGMVRVVAVFGPPRWVGRDVAVQRRFTPDDVFVIIAPQTDDGARRTGDDVGGRRAAASAVILALMFCR